VNPRLVLKNERGIVSRVTVIENGKLVTDYKKENVTKYGAYNLFLSSDHEYWIGIDDKRHQRRPQHERVFSSRRGRIVFGAGAGDLLPLIPNSAGPYVVLRERRVSRH